MCIGSYITDMPELPEVHTTVTGLRKNIVGLRISDVWTDYNSPYFKGSNTIKDPIFYKKFKGITIGKKIISVERRAKNILIELENEIIVLIHLKMTGHLLYGEYIFDKSKKNDPWEAVYPESLRDPFNSHVHLVFSLSNKKYLALSDTRTFAKVTFFHKKELLSTPHLEHLGPEPISDNFSFKEFSVRIRSKNSGKIKLILMDQTVIAGIGNIYADETLWQAGIHPLRDISTLSSMELHRIYNSMRMLLNKSISLGGDSMSDYRNIDGERGGFQKHHNAYKRKGLECMKKGCKGIIKRIVVGGRGTHFCDMHQIKP